MAFDPSSNNREYKFYFKIELNGLTLYLSDQYFTLSDGTAVDGVIVGASPLVRRAGNIQDPRFEFPSLSIDIDNGQQLDGSRFQDYFDLYTWAGRAVTLYIGQGTTVGNFESVFTGVTKFPAGLFWDDEIATIRLIDNREADARALPSGTFTKTLYANMEDLYVNTSIPIVYGDWQTTAANGETVPCVQIDSTAGTGGKFKIAGHALKSIEAVYLNGSDITGNCTLDAANGEFTISSTSTYTSGTDTVTANVQGATDDGTTSGTLLQTAPDVLNDILKTHLGVAAGNIDSTALTAWGAELSVNDYVRRAINTETASSTLIAELLNDGFADLSIVGGKYTPKYRVVSVGANLNAYTGGDLVSDASGRKFFEIHHDPESLYVNDLIAVYGQRATAATFAGRYAVEDTGAIADAGMRVRRQLSLKWLYIQAGAEARADKELYTFGQIPESISVTLSPVASTLTPTDQFRLVYSKYPETAEGGTPFQVRDISLNLIDLSTSITAWSMVRLLPRYWTDGSGASWATATTKQKEQQGFWTNDDGEADPGDSASVGSVWQ